ncbi:hypothetical protein [Cytobacillus oceanisediminis]|uniref:hypothetical protein n=1 Tax=Cytobacillus oceanisediminis TaxID=665099 RepID=UPI001FB1CD99|nr:hypothetical protein [Cytobacillus oceanisediminis]UOE58172.1 hypothetical protein IRB79_27080 [Cytobacillus oceanisediminis]
MSNQRRMRSELKQGLHQFTMTLYKSYRESLSHEDAIQEIVTCLEEEHGYFSNQSIKKEEQQSQPLSMEEYIELIEKRSKAEEVPEKQYEYYNDLETLMSAQEIIRKYTSTGE